MSGHAVHVLQDLKSRVEAANNRLVRLEALQGRLESEKSTLQADIQTLSSKIEKFYKVEELFKALLDVLLVKQVRAIEALVSGGLQSIFSDQQLQFKSEITPKNNKVSVNFVIQRGADDDPLAITGDPLDSFGGGPATVAALILRILILTKLKKYPFVLLDETLWPVSAEYIENTGLFLRSLADSMGLHILMITHKDAFLEHATQAYRGVEEALSSSRTRLQLRTL